MNTPHTPSRTRSPSTCGGKCARGFLSQLNISSRRSLASALTTFNGTITAKIANFLIRGQAPALSQRDRVNLDSRVSGQPRNLDCRSSRGRRREIASVYFIHPGEVVHISEKHGTANYFLQTAARRRQYRGQVPERPIGLLGDIAVDHSSGLGLHRNLARDKDKPHSAYCLREWPDRGRCVRGRDHFSHCSLRKTFA